MKAAPPLIFLFTLIIISPEFGLAQSVDCQLNEDFTITIDGTSNVHDWTSEVTKVKGDGTYSFAEDGTLNIHHYKVNIPVNSIKSSKGSIMDKKTWKALKQSEHPTIVFQLNNFAASTTGSKTFVANTSGKLTIAGVSNTINMRIMGKVLPNHSIEIAGSKKLKMTDFDIDPPTALLGTMTTGDEVTVNFRILIDRK